MACAPMLFCENNFHEFLFAVFTKFIALNKEETVKYFQIYDKTFNKDQKFNVSLIAIDNI